METCATPFCENPATDAFRKLSKAGESIIEYHLCRDHAKQIIRDFAKRGILWETGPIQ